MSSIVLLPGFIAAYIAFKRSLHLAFLNVYIPVLLFLPMYYQWIIPSIPDLSFSDATLLPLILYFLIRGMPGWRFSVTDVLVFTFAFFVGTSEYLNSNYKEAQNLIANMILAIIFPYLLTKSLIEPNGLRVEFIKRIVLVLFVVSFFLVYESFTPYSHGILRRILGGYFFPGQGWRVALMTRWGFARAPGPFIHPILAGMVMVIGFLLQQWLEWNKVWSTSRLWGFPKGKMISLMLFLGVLAPISRGPWLGGIFAMITIFSLSALFSLTRQPRFRYLLVGVLLGSIMVVGMITREAFIQFASVTPEEAGQTSTERGNVAYRFKLYESYGRHVMERWLWGWGRTGLPPVEGQKSVDNAFLYLALTHGLVSLVSLFMILIYLIIRLFIHTVHHAPTDFPRSSFGLILLAILIHEVIGLTTVWLADVNMVLLFMVFGWSDAYLSSRQSYSSPISQSQPSPKLTWGYHRTI